MTVEEYSKMKRKEIEDRRKERADK